MANILIDISDGWTGALPFTLKADAVAVDLTGLTVTAVIRDRTETVVDTAGDVTADPDQVTNKGKLTLNADAADFIATKSPYSVKFKVIDGSGKIVFFPNGEPDQIRVHPA